MKPRNVFKDRAHNWTARKAAKPAKFLLRQNFGPKITKMCIVFFSISDNPLQDGYKLIVGVNRDEYINRPTKELHWWKDRPDILSGSKNTKLKL